MATAFTSLLGLALPVTGELAGTWGDTVNNSITSLLDSAVAGTTTLSTDADVTLTTLTGASNQARQAILLCSGARTVLRNITAPAQSKMYVVINSTTGGFGVVIRGVGPTTGVTVANGKTAVVVWNGTDFVEVAPAVATNLSGGTAGAVPYQTAANTTTFLAIGAANYVLTSTGAAPTWTLNTGTGSVVRATSPTLVTPILGTPQSGTLTNCTGLPISTGVSGLGAGIATFLATPSSANLAAAVTDETGTGALVFGTSPTITTPTITTSATIPLLIGGTGTTSTLTLRSTSGVGTTGADIIFQTGNNGATEAMRIVNGGDVGIGTATLASIGATYRTVTLNASGGSGFALQSGGTTQGLIWADSTLGLVLSGTSGGTTPVTFRTNNTERMRVGSDGRVGINTTSPQALLHVSVDGNGALFSRDGAAAVVARSAFDTNADGSFFIGQRARTSVAAPSIVTSGDRTIEIWGRGYDGATYQSAGRLTVDVDGTPAAGSMPGRMVFFTTPTATVTPVERMRITNAGDVGIGTTAPGVKLDVAGSFNVTGNATLGDATTDTVTVNGYMAVGSTPVASQGLRVIPSGLTGTFQFGSVLSLTATSAATAGVEGARVQAGTAAAAFTTTYAAGLWVRDALRGAGSTITNNYGIYIDEKVAGTNNYGLVTNIASGANKWNLYIDGTATSYFAGSVGVGTSAPTCAFEVVASAAASIPAAGAVSSHAEIGVGVYGTSFGTIGSGRGYIQQQRTDGTATTYDLLLQPNGSTLGVGTTNPLSAVRLHVEQNANANYSTSFSPGTTPSQLVLRDISDVATYTNPFAAVQFGAGNTGAGFSYIAGARESAGASFLALGTGTSGAATERMRITSAGLVGIGTNAPTARLHVYGGSYTLYRQETTSGTTEASWSNTLGNTIIGTDGAAGHGYAGTFVAKEFRLYTNSAERMRIDTSGNVGIGVTPNTILTVASATPIIQIRDLTSATTDVGAKFYLQGYTNGVTGLANFAILTGAKENATAGNGAGYFAIQTSNSIGVNAEAMRIDSAGNVGIGTTAPVNKLQVNGSFGRNAPVTKATSFTLAATENWVICNGTATITVTLPAASSWTGREVMLKTVAAFTVVSASSNVVPLAGGAAGTAILAATAGKWVTLVSDGTNWITMAGA